LLKPFVWAKKKEKDVRDGRLDAHEGVTESESKRLETISEIQQIRQRRKDREQELEEMSRLRSEESRLREAAQYGDWQAKEEEFHVEQARIRSKIRISEKREHVIDLLAKNILVIEEATAHEKEKEIPGTTKDVSVADAGIELRDPISLIDELRVSDLVAVLADVESYVELETRNKGQYIRFWKSIAVVIKSIQDRESSNDNTLHKAVENDVQSLFQGKNMDDLKRLRGDIDAGIQDGSRTDTQYWGHMSRAVAAEEARLYVLDTHASLLKKQADILRLQKNAGGGGAKAKAEAEACTVPSASSSTSLDIPAGEDGTQEGDKEEEMKDQDEVELAKIAHYHWQDKYRPRKPRYLNRVRTGWDWNKYNSTHYDHDNPPPRTVQGYKFTVFYPDLLDKSNTPKYFLEAADSPEFALLRFHAPGGPYEDVAFKILNKEWDVNRKSGFRCTFDRGVLQLHFNYKRAWYRR
jgi:hypothetical protein